MSTKIDFPSDVEIGKFYIVPHVLTTEFNWIKNVYVPINSPLHEDVEIIKFHYNHWHIDWRFVPNNIYKRAVNDYSEVADQAKYIIIYGNDHNYTSKSVTKEIFYLRRKCVRKYLSSQLEEKHSLMYNSWPRQLQKAYSCKRLKQNEKGQYICPHKGTIIDLTHKDAEGNVVCPAHFLKFNNQLEAI